MTAPTSPTLPWCWRRCWLSRPSCCAGPSDRNGGSRSPAGLAEDQVSIWCAQLPSLLCSVNDAANVPPCATWAYLIGGPVLTCAGFTGRRWLSRGYGSGARGPTHSFGRLPISRCATVTAPSSGLLFGHPMGPAALGRADWPVSVGRGWTGDRGTVAHALAVLDPGGATVQLGKVEHEQHANTQAG